MRRTYRSSAALTSRVQNAAEDSWGTGRLLQRMKCFLAREEVIKHATQHDEYEA